MDEIIRLRERVKERTLENVYFYLGWEGVREPVKELSAGAGRRGGFLRAACRVAKMMQRIRQRGPEP